MGLDDNAKEGLQGYFRFDVYVSREKRGERDISSRVSATSSEWPGSYDWILNQE